MWNGSNKSTKRQTHKKTQFPQIPSYLIWMYLKTLFWHYVSNEPEGMESFNLACCNVRGETGFLLLLYVSAWLKSQTLCFNASNSTSFQITPLFVWCQIVTDFYTSFFCVTEKLDTFNRWTTKPWRYITEHTSKGTRVLKFNYTNDHTDFELCLDETKHCTVMRFKALLNL